LNYDYINLMWASHITAGCSYFPPLYCPDLAVTRAQMATFVVSALDHINHSAQAIPTNYTRTPYFVDEPADDQYYPFVQRLADLRITNGCSLTQFCTSQSITQGQMAKFIILGWMHANNITTLTYTTTPYFTDVVPADILFPYIQKMRDLGFRMGCTATTYCEN